MIKIYAPATIANLNVGFDVLGAAVSPIDGSYLGDTVEIALSNTLQFENKGRFVDKLPTNPKENITYHCWKRFCDVIGEEHAVTITLEKNMPIGSGLGSSACSSVATLVALNALFEQPLNQQQLLALMGEMEGVLSGGVHYDNVAPSYLGGMQLILNEPNYIAQPLPYFENWYFILAFPDICVKTADSRAVLPATYSRQDCILHSKDLAGFVHASYTKQEKLAAQLMRDNIAEPYRLALLPRFAENRDQVLKMGALACGISGSGPTLFAIADHLARAETIAAHLNANYIQQKDGFVHICQIDKNGARKVD